MSFKQEKVSMPMGSAGIIGFSSDMEISGLKVDPKVIVIGALIFALLIKIAGIFVK